MLQQDRNHLRAASGVTSELLSSRILSNALSALGQLGWFAREHARSCRRREARGSPSGEARAT